MIDLLHFLLLIKNSVKAVLSRKENALAGVSFDRLRHTEHINTSLDTLKLANFCLQSLIGLANLLSGL